MNYDRLRSVYSRALRLEFSPSPWVSVKDLLALVAVAARIKPVAAFGFLSDDNEGAIRSLRDRVIDLGLRALITAAIRKSSARHLDGFSTDVVRAFELFDKEKGQGRRDFLLWVTRESAVISEIKLVVDAPASVGRLLGYPLCCVEHEEGLHREMQRAFTTGLVEAVGADTEKLLSALRDDLGVTTEIGGRMTLWQTDQAYPFVFHSACELCLASDQSPTALMNKQYESFAADIDPALHRTIMQMAEVEVQFGQICSGAEAKGLSPDSIDEKTKARLGSLSKRCDRLRDELLAGPCPL